MRRRVSSRSSYAKGFQQFACLTLLAFFTMPFPALAQMLQPGEGVEDDAADNGFPSDSLSSETRPDDAAVGVGSAPLPDAGSVSAPEAEATEPEPFVPPQPPKNLNTALLQGLNKVTARIQEIEAPLGEVARFGNLEIIARSCWQSSPDDDAQENASLLEIWELKSGESPLRIFMGWMFASTPSLSTLQHPVYDITVRGCVDKALTE